MHEKRNWRKNRTGKQCKLNLKVPSTKSSNEFGEWFWKSLLKRKNSVTYYFKRSPSRYFHSFPTRTVARKKECLKKGIVLFLAAEWPPHKEVFRKYCSSGCHISPAALTPSETKTKEKDTLLDRTIHNTGLKMQNKGNIPYQIQISCVHFHNTP